MTNRMRDEKGFALIYGLIVLVLATVGGTALLFIAQKDHVSSSNYSQMLSASQAASAALKACEGQFLQSPETSLAILKKYLSNNNYKWLLGTSSDVANTEQRIKFWNGDDSPQYSAKILGYDKDNSLLIIEGKGYGSNGGVKKVIASYQVDGLAMVTTSAPGHSLFLAGGFGTGNDALTINGNVFLGGTNLINANGPITINDGYLKTGTGSFTSNAQISVTGGNAFFRGSTVLQGAGSSIIGKTGFKSSLHLNAVDLAITGDVFVNGDDLGTGRILVPAGPYTAKYYTAGGFDPSEIVVTAPATKLGVASSINIATELGIADVDDAPSTIVNNLETFITSNGGTIYNPTTAGLDFNVIGWNLGTAYLSKSLWHNFLVIKTTFPLWLNASGGTFDGKVIWIIDMVNIGFETQKWYCSGPNSNTLIYIKGSAYLDNFGQLMDGSPLLFRGIIYNSSTNMLSATTYKFKPGTSVQGCIIHSGAMRPIFNYGGTGNFSIDNNEEVINEFVSIGVFTPAGGGSTTELTLVDLKIRLTRLCVQL